VVGGSWKQTKGIIKEALLTTKNGGFFKINDLHFWPEQQLNAAREALRERAGRTRSVHFELDNSQVLCFL
jgi:hypothetical protein